MPPGGGRGDHGADRGTPDGAPGICFVTRGPGATNAAHGVHIAEHDSAPMILFVGQVERAMLGRGAFQEMDYRELFRLDRQMGRQIKTAAQIPEIVHRAFHVAMQGRPGPVVIALPEDMLSETAEVVDAPRVDCDPDLAGSHPNGRAAKTALERRSGRSRSLEGQAGPNAPALRSLASLAFRPARRRLVPSRKRFRRRARELRRRNRIVRQSEAQGAHRERRCRDARRRAHVGGRRAGLHAVRHSSAAAAACSCSCGPTRVGRNYHPTLGIVATRLSSAPRLRA